MRKVTTPVLLPILATIIACSSGQGDPLPEPKEPVVPPENSTWEYSMPPAYKSSSTFIVAYLNPQKIIAQFISLKYSNPDDLNSSCYDETDDIWTHELHDTDSIGITCQPDILPETARIDSPEIYSNTTTSSLFYAIAQDNNDNGYHGYHWDPYWYLYCPTQYINITCGTDYDQTHPAGSLLNDILNINYYTAKPFIDSKFKDLRLGDYVKSRTTEPLAEFNKKNVNLLSMSIYCILTKRPEKAGDYQFTVTYCNKDGVTLSATTVPIKLLAR